MTNRLDLLKNHLSTNWSYNARKITEKSEDDIVIVGFARSAMSRARKGPFRNTPLELMLKPILHATVEMSGVSREKIDDIQVGNVLAPGAGAVTARIAQFLDGIPHETTTAAVNRLCSSGLQSVANIAMELRVGQIELGIAAGFESMTMNPFEIVERDRLSKEAYAL